MLTRWKPIFLAVVAISAVVATASGAAAPRPGIHPIPTNLATLRDAVARGTLIAIDPRARVAEVRIKCGWYIRPKRRTRAGLWRVPLSGLTFEWESYPNGPASGISHTESITSWERRAEHNGWSGTLYLSTRNGLLTDGPTTDICAGVLG